MSKKYLTGSKRLQIINKWLCEIDDLVYNVLPTRKEGRYTIKLRKDTTSIDTIKESKEQIEPAEKEQEEPIEETKSALKSASKPRVIQQIYLNSSSN